MSSTLAFALPQGLEAHEPPEARGLTRDAVRMLVAARAARRITHSTFALLPSFLEPGDLVVVNTSGTLAAAVDGVDERGSPLVVHFSSQLGTALWVVEPRRVGKGASQRWDTSAGPPPQRVRLAGGPESLELLAPYRGSRRLWVAQLAAPAPAFRWMAARGRPIRYGYVERGWPLSYYQNVYQTEPGSAEMPSAGRPFSPEMITRLVANGVGVAPLVLHTGVASLEAEELPCPEPVRVGQATADLVNLAKARGRRVVAVGTTVVRALESAYDPRDASVHRLDGWTDVVITPERGVRVVDGVLTGWHEPRASHLMLLEAVAGRELLERCYDAALTEGYLWHEFGDVHLVLP